MNEKSFLDKVLNKYRSLTSYSDTGIMLHYLEDESSNLGVAKLLFKTIYKAPNFFYCHFDFAMSPPFEYMVTKTSIGYDGNEAYMYERDHEHPPELVKGTFRNILSKSMSASFGLTSEIAALLMPNTGSFEIINLNSPSFGEDKLIDGCSYVSINGFYPNGLKTSLFIDRDTLLVKGYEETGKTGTAKTIRQETVINGKIPDEIFIAPK